MTDLSNVRLCIVVKEFSPYGGLELYNYQLVKGLLNFGLKITVLCEEDKSDFSHDNLSIRLFAKPSKNLSKWLKLKHQFQVASEAVRNAGPFDLVHSQHFPVHNAQLATFHNHTVDRTTEVGYPWERALNSLKAKFMPAYRLRHFFDEYLCKQASCLIFPAQAMQKDFYSAYPFLEREKKPFAIAYPGIIPNRQIVLQQEIDKKKSLSTMQPFTLLFVGRGKRKKGLDTLIAALHQLKSEKRQFKLLIAGIRPKLLDMPNLKLNGLDKNVIYLGFQRDMKPIYAQAQAIVVPAKMEPFGMSIVEAMQHGLAPIVSRVSGVSELLEPGKDALILENHLDANELASLILELSTDEKLMSIISQNAYEKANTITWDNTVKNTLNAYEIALSAISKQKRT